MTRWAVTGATGFLGRALVRRCSDADELSTAGAEVPEVLGIVRRLPGEPIKGVRYAPVGDLSGPVDWQAPLSGVEVLVHTAARVHVMAETASDSLAEFRRVNVQGTLQLARGAADAGVKRLVFISSIKVLGEATPPGVPFLPNTAPAPEDPYGISKMEAEQGLLRISAATGMEVVIIRPPLVYGPVVKANFGALMRAVLRGLPLPLASIQNQRSLVGLDNLVDFVITCARHPRAANEIFLVSDGRDLSTPELIREMAAAGGVIPHLWPVPVWALQAAGRVMGKGLAVQRLCGNLQVDISKARDVLGWLPPLSVQESLRRAMISDIQLN